MRAICCSWHRGESILISSLAIPCLLGRLHTDTQDVAFTQDIALTTHQCDLLRIQNCSRAFATESARVPQVHEASIAKINRIRFGLHHASDWAISRRCQAEELRTNGAVSCSKKIGSNRIYERTRTARPSRVVVTIFLMTKKFANAKRTSNVA